MTFYEKLDQFQSKLLTYCIECIIENHTLYFNQWLEHESDISDGYCQIAKKYFEEYITKEISTQLYFAGKNVIYGIQTFIAIHKEYELHELLKFVELFISKQLDDFDNDYDITEWFIEGH